jgi:hypothetical protein
MALTLRAAAVVKQMTLSTYATPSARREGEEATSIYSNFGS